MHTLTTTKRATPQKKMDESATIFAPLTRFAFDVSKAWFRKRKSATTPAQIAPTAKAPQRAKLLTYAGAAHPK